MRFAFVHFGAGGRGVGFRVARQLTITADYVRGGFAFSGGRRPEAAAMQPITIIPCYRTLLHFTWDGPGAPVVCRRGPGVCLGCTWDGTRRGPDRGHPGWAVDYANLGGHSPFIFSAGRPAAGRPPELSKSWALGCFSGEQVLPVLGFNSWAAHYVDQVLKPCARCCGGRLGRPWVARRRLRSRRCF